MLDSSGSANIWLAGLSYKFVMQDALGNQLWSIDNVSDVAFINGLNAMLLTGNQTAAGNKTFTGNTTIANLTLGSFDNFLYVDGVTYPTIQSAVNALPPGGGTVYIPCGNYTLSSTLALTGPLVLQGCGMGSAQSGGGTRLIAGSGALTPVVSIQGVSAANRTTNLFIRDLTIQGVYTVSQNCLLIDHATYVVLDHVQFAQCGQAEWINDSYRAVHNDASYYQSGSGGTNLTATVRVENTSNPGVPTEQSWWTNSTWQGGSQQGTAVYFGPKENQGRIMGSKIDYTGFTTPYCLIQVNQGADISLIDDSFNSPNSTAPANGIVCEDGTAPIPAFNISILNSYFTYVTVPAVWLNFSSYYQIDNNNFFGTGSGNPAVVTTANTSVGNVMMNRINTSPDTIMNDVSGIAVACNASNGANQLACTTPITTNKPIVSTSTLSTTQGLTDTSAATKTKRNYCTQGTALVPGDFVLTGWGTSPSIVVGGTDCLFGFTLTAGTGSPAANPTVVLTYHDGAWLGSSPVCQVSRGESQTPSTAPWQTSGSTTVNTFTFVGTPIVSTPYVLNVTCGGRN